MRAFANKKILAPLAALAAVAGFAVVGASVAPAAPVAISLCASDGSITMPDGVSVPVWGFVQTASCAPGLVNSSNFAGPPIVVNAGDAVTITLRNALPGSHGASFELSGLPVTKTGVSYPLTFSFNASRPGTFVYQSPGDAGRQMAMGLYGALVVRPTSAPNTPIPGRAYNDPSTAFDGEQTLVLSAIDPVFNATPDTFDMNDYLATYWLINGKAYPTTPSIPAPTTGTRRLLLRYVNAGFDNTAMSLLGVHEHVIARDAYPLSNPFDAAAETIPAGGTEDAIVTVPLTGAPSASGFPLFNRNLHVANGTACVTTNPCVPRTNHTPGGMLTFITP